MAIEALKSVGAVYQASSTPEIAKEVSQPKTQIIDIQTGSAALAADAVKVNAKEANEQQGSGQIGGRRYGNSDQWFNIRTGHRLYRTGTGISIFHQERKYRKEADKAFLDTGCVEGNEYKNLRFLQ